MPSQTYDHILTKGLQSSLPTTNISDGKIRLATDSQKLFIDHGTGASATRIEITDFVKGLNSTQILGLSSPLDKIYLASDTFVLYYYDTTTSTWINLTTASLGALATKSKITIDDVDEDDGLDFGDEDLEEEQEES